MERPHNIIININTNIIIKAMALASCGTCGHMREEMQIFGVFSDLLHYNLGHGRP